MDPQKENLSVPADNTPSLATTPKEKLSNTSQGRSGNFDVPPNGSGLQPNATSNPSNDTYGPIYSANSMAIANPSKKSKKKLPIIATVIIVVLGILVAGNAFLSNVNKPGNPNDTSTWKQYTSSDDGFSANFISKPTRKTNNPTETFLSKSSDSNNEYTVGVINGSSTLGQADVTNAINSSVEVLQNGTIQTQHTKTVDGQTVNEVTFTGERKGQQQFWTMRIFVKDNKMYEVITVGVGRPAINSSYFIDTFKILQ